MGALASPRGRAGTSCHHPPHRRPGSRRAALPTPAKSYDPLSQPFSLADCAELAYADSYAAAACGDPTPLPDPPAPFPRSVEPQLLTGVLHLAALEQLTLRQVAAWFEAEDLTEVMDLIRSCSQSYLCTAGPGYDGPTGLGTPNGTTAFAG